MQKRKKLQTCTLAMQFQPVLIMLTVIRNTPGPEVVKKNSCSTQLSVIFFQIINVKMPTFVGILTFMSRKNSILVLSEHEKC